MPDNNDEKQMYTGILQTRKHGKLDVNPALPLTIGDWAALKRKDPSITAESLRSGDPVLMASFAEFVFAKANIPDPLAKALDLTIRDLGRLMDLIGQSEDDIDVPTPGSSIR